MLRIFLAFAFVPAGLKKVLRQPFTDPEKAGVFHEFLHAFHATGAFYQFVGTLQLLAAALLLSQRFAVAGEMLFGAIITVILVFCWSTAVYPTAVVVTLMFLANLALLLWDLDRWRSIFAARPLRSGTPALADQRRWARCGFLVTGLYLGACLATGGVYRPMGAEFGRPEFYVFPVMLLVVAATWLIDARSGGRTEK